MNLSKYTLTFISTLLIWLFLLVKAGTAFISVLINDSSKLNITLVLSLSFAFLACLYGFWSIYVLAHRSKSAPMGLPEEIKSSPVKQDDYVSSLSSIMSIIGIALLNFSTLEGLVMLIVFAIIIIVCFRNSSICLTNPIITLLGYKSATIRTTDNQFSAIFKDDLTKGDMIDKYHIADHIYLVKKHA